MRHKGPAEWLYIYYICNSYSMEGGPEGVSGSISAQGEV